MLPTNAAYTTKDEKVRRKKVLRAFREDRDAKIWNKVVDEVGPCELTALNDECESFDFLVPFTDPELEYSDEEYPNKAETWHNIFPCD